MKALFKQILKSLPFHFTKNQRYDALTRQVIKKVCSLNTNTVDVGCHKGEILDLILAAAPNGKHYGFEPIPVLYENLVQKYGTNPQCVIMDIALSNQEGTSSFNYVVSNPSYSGLLKRTYDRADEKDTLITVRTARLDDVIPEELSIGLLKIDVEGGEMLVLEGAQETLKRWKPVVIFEHGIGASDIYGSKPETLFDLLEDCGLKVTLLNYYMQDKAPLTKTQFCQQYYERLNYYFLAY